MGVLFPAMAAAHAGGKKNLTELYATSAKVIFWAMLPLTAGASLLAPEALLLWLGRDFMHAATPVVYWLAAGWMINTLARPAFTVLQSTGHPDLVAKTHLAELIPYLGLLWWLTSSYGITGAAAAWTLRVIADVVILNAIAAQILPSLKKPIRRNYLALLITVVAFGCIWGLQSIFLRAFLLLLITIVAITVLWPIFGKALHLNSRSLNKHAECASGNSPSRQKVD